MYSRGDISFTTGYTRVTGGVDVLRVARHVLPCGRHMLYPRVSYLLAVISRDPCAEYYEMQHNTELPAENTRAPLP